MKNAFLNASKSMESSEQIKAMIFWERSTTLVVGGGKVNGWSIEEQNLLNINSIRSIPFAYFVNP